MVSTKLDSPYVQAASTYEKITESFARAVAEINDTVSTLQREVYLYDDLAMKQFVVRLYTQIFAFLVNVMRWYTDKARNRIRRSLNESLYEKYQLQLVDIRHISDLMREEAKVRMAYDVRAGKLTAKSIDSDLKFLIKMYTRDQQAREMREANYFDIIREHLEQIRKEQLKQDPQVMSEVFRKFFAEEVAGSTIRMHLEGQAQSCPLPGEAAGNTISSGTLKANSVFSLLISVRSASSSFFSQPFPE